MSKKRQKIAQSEKISKNLACSEGLPAQQAFVGMLKGLGPYFHSKKPGLPEFHWLPAGAILRP